MSCTFGPLNQITQRRRSSGCGSAGAELPHVQGEEQQLGFAGAAVKRHPTSKVRETQVRR